MIGSMIIFWILGGFTWPINTLNIDQAAFDGEVGGNWMVCFSMYIIGAISFSLVEHKIGIIEPVSIRGVYVMAGLGLMIGSLAWWYAIKYGY